MRGDGEEAVQLLAEVYAGAAPVPTIGFEAAETVILAAPLGEAGDRLRELAAVACPGVEFVLAPLADDVMICREPPRVELTALPQMTALAREAYDAQLAAEQTPHTRIDVPWTAPG